MTDGGAPRPRGTSTEASGRRHARATGARGATVVVTKERDGGTRAPTSKPLITVKNASQS